MINYSFAINAIAKKSFVPKLMLVNNELLLKHSLLIWPHKRMFRKRLFSSTLNSSLSMHKVTVLLVFNLPP